MTGNFANAKKIGIDSIHCCRDTVKLGAEKAAAIKMAVSYNGMCPDCV